MTDFLSAARWTSKDHPEPHQIAAWNAAWQWLSEDQKSEFLELFRAAPELKDMLEPAWMAPALKIIKEFEGFRNEAYRCPAGVPTIGYGATRYQDGPVRMGDTIAKDEAEKLLAKQLQELFAPGLFALLPQAKKWPANQQAALISWAFNVGLGSVEQSTLRKRITSGEGAGKVIAEELPKWNQGDGKVLPGLVRRRSSEVALFMGIQQQGAVKLTPGASWSFRITPHISYGELCNNGEEARRFTNQGQCDIAMELCDFLEKARSRFGNNPIIITSGHRPSKINAQVGGATLSEHLFKPNEGAVDFYIKNADIFRVQEWCDKAWPYSLGYGAPKGFVHLGIRAKRPRVRWDY